MPHLALKINKGYQKPGGDMSLPPPPRYASVVKDAVSLSCSCSWRIGRARCVWWGISSQTSPSGSTHPIQIFRVYVVVCKYSVPHDVFPPNPGHGAIAYCRAEPAPSIIKDIKIGKQSESHRIWITDILLSSLHFRNRIAVFAKCFDKNIKFCDIFNVNGQKTSCQNFHEKLDS